MPSVTPSTLPSGAIEGSPTKRRRLDENAAPDPSGQASASATGVGGLVRDEDYWLDDGNIVLAVQGRTFRVHKSVLCRTAPFFSTLFSVPQPADRETMEGCPLVHMQDSLQEVRLLLRIIYNGKRCAHNPFV